jgi:DHA2 family multidrug resistance protein
VEPSKQALLYGEMQRQAALLAFIDVFWILGVLCLAIIPFMFVLKNSPPQGPSPLGH